MINDPHSVRASRLEKLFQFSLLTLGPSLAQNRYANPNPPLGSDLFGLFACHH